MNGVASKVLTARRLDLPEGNRGESNARWALSYSAGKVMAHLTGGYVTVGNPSSAEQ